MKQLAFKKSDIHSLMNKTKDRNIWIDELGIFVSNLLSVGNSKLSNKVLIFDLLAINSCWNCSLCKDTCYAVKTQKLYPNVYNKRLVNTYLAKSNLPLLQELITKQLNKSNKNIVRIHSSGDFVSQQYIDMWTNVAKNTDKYFYFYTKVDNMFNFSNLIKNHRVNMIESILPDGSTNYGSYKEMLIKHNEFNIPICMCGIDENTRCMDNCFKCLSNSNILFIKH